MSAARQKLIFCQIEFQPPFEAPTYEFKGDTLIATVPGKFVDTWVKVK